MFSDLVDSYAVPLCIPTVMRAVLKIIVENTPELRALDLSDNNLCTLDSLCVLSAKLPNLRVLHIAGNQVSLSIQSN
jgi:Leucine-rich repeat (LRR) protein